MLLDIRRHVRGSWDDVAVLFGCNQPTVRRWLRKDGNPDATSRRLIWLLWLMLCRPGSFPITVWQLSCHGRSRELTDPCNAGVDPEPED
jgi:hypothetical protein